jgi:carbonic anhydrase
MRYWKTLTPLSVFLAAWCLAQDATPAVPPPGHEWTYEGAEGPKRWGDLKPGFATCKLEHKQSPIDIRDPKKTSLPPIQFDYKASPLKIINNGHTIQVNYAPGSFIAVGDKRYELRQFHFHHPSEEHIDGKAYDMVIHLVHADPDGHLAVVAVLLHKGSANPVIQKLWENLPQAEGKEQAVSGVEVNAAALLPEPLGYYTFEGSLTTPPCTEQVTWFVLKTPLDLSAQQVAAFAKLYPHNARPTQPLNGRVVAETQ